MCELQHFRVDMLSTAVVARSWLAGIKLSAFSVAKLQSHGRTSEQGVLEIQGWFEAVRAYPDLRQIAQFVASFQPQFGHFPKLEILRPPHMPSAVHPPLRL